MWVCIAIVVGVIGVIVSAFVYFITKPLGAVFAVLSAASIVLIPGVPYRTKAFAKFLSIQDEYDELCKEIAAIKDTNGEISPMLYKRIVAHNKCATAGCGSDFWESSFTGFGYNAGDFIIDLDSLTAADDVYVLQEATPEKIIYNGNMYALQE